MEHPARLLCRPALVRDSEFFTASPAVPLPARRVLHTGHPKDENKTWVRFFKVKPNLQLYVTLYHVREHEVQPVATCAGRPLSSLERVVAEVLFVLKEGCSWRALDVPDIAWQTVHGHFRRWAKKGLWDQAVLKFHAMNRAPPPRSRVISARPPQKQFPSRPNQPHEYALPKKSWHSGQESYAHWL